MIVNFIMDLKPKSFKYNDGTSGRTHYGLISQDVLSTLNKYNISTQDFGGYIRWQKTKEVWKEVEKEIEETDGSKKKIVTNERFDEPISGEYEYGLRYEEFIAPLICMVQKQQKEINDLKQQLANKN